MGKYLTPTEHAERVISHYLCLRQLPPKVTESIKKRIVFEIEGYAERGTDKKTGRKVCPRCGKLVHEGRG